MRRTMFASLFVPMVLIVVLPCGEALAAQGKLTSSDGAVYDRFGFSSSISGDYAIVGSYGDDDNGWDSGAAYIFHYDGISWTEEAKLLPNDGDEYDRFGYSVSISGDYAIVGAYCDDDNGWDSGSAYVFRNDGMSWTEEAKLTPSDGAECDRFGFSVSISGDDAIVGAYTDDDNEWDSGSAYVFHNDGISWTEEAKLIPGDGTEDDYFGFSVSISGDCVIAGAYGDDDNGRDSGSAYTFRYDGTSWTEEAKLIPGDGTEDDYFGFSVSISGDRAILGACADDDKGLQSGAAYMFRYDGASWINEVKLTASDGAAHDYFGFAVSIFDNYAAVGACHDDDKGWNSGSAYIFGYDGFSWTEQTKIIPGDGVEDDYFGFSVSVSGDRVIVGSPFYYYGMGSAWVAPVPELSSIALICIGMLSLVGYVGLMRSRHGCKGAL